MRLWSWFCSWFVAVPEERYDVYRPEQRLIYLYFDGATEIKADPLALYKRLMTHNIEISIDLKVALSPSKDADVAYAKAIERMRLVFGLRPFADGGLSDLEVMGLFNHFLTYSGWLKKNMSQIVTSLGATSPSTGSSSKEDQPTTNTSVSGSTANEHKIDKAEPSVSASASPSV